MAVTTICGPASSTAGNPAGPWRPVTGGASGGGIATEANTQGVIRNPGTFSRLQLNQNAVGITYTLRKNGANSALLVTSTATAGIFTDSTHSVAFAAGDKHAFALSTSGHTAYVISSDFVADSGNPVTHYHTLGSATAGTNYVPPVASGAQFNATESNAQFRIRSPGTLKNYCFNAASNSNGSAQTQS